MMARLAVAVALYHIVFVCDTRVQVFNVDLERFTAWVPFRM